MVSFFFFLVPYGGFRRSDVQKLCNLKTPALVDVYRDELLHLVDVRSDQYIEQHWPRADQTTEDMLLSWQVQGEHFKMKARAQCWFFWDSKKHAELVAEYKAYQEEKFPTREQYRAKLKEAQKKEAAKPQRAQQPKGAEPLARIPKSKWSQAAIQLHLKTNLDEKAVSMMEGFLVEHGHTASTILEALQVEATGPDAKIHSRREMQHIVDEVNRQKAEVTNAKQQGKAILTIMEQHQIRIQDEWAETFCFKRSPHLDQTTAPVSMNPPSTIEVQDLATIEGLVEAGHQFLESPRKGKYYYHRQAGFPIPYERFKQLYGEPRSNEEYVFPHQPPTPRSGPQRPASEPGCRS